MSSIHISQLKRFGRGRTRSVAGEMNKTEAAYAKHLETMKAANEIQDWKYEPFSMRIAPSTHYRPDFGVLANDGYIEIHEVKGHMEDDAWVKLKVVAANSWFRVFVVKRKGGAWEVTQVGADG